MSKIEELIEGLCPEGVEFRRLGEVCEIKTGKGIVQNDCSEENGYPVISGGKTPMGFYRFSNRCKNTVTVSRVGANAGFVNYITSDFYLNDKCFSVIQFSDKTDSKYLYYSLKNLEKRIIELQSKGGVPTINTQKIGNLEIPLPPLAVQEEIVRILDAFTSLEAELEAELEARKKQYAYYRDTLLSFDRDDPNVEWKRLGEVGTFTYGYTAKAQEEGDTRFIRITDITESGCLNPNNAKYITLSEESKKYLAKKGDLLLARTGATYGKTLYMQDDIQAVYASFLIKIVLDNSLITNRYYWHFSKSTFYWQQAEKLVTKGGQEQFNANAVSRILIPLPPLSAQRKIEEILDKFEALTSDFQSGLPAEIDARRKQYEYYRDRLLTFKVKSEE